MKKVLLGLLLLFAVFTVQAQSVQWKNFSHTYCVDITDKDPHSPISSHAFVTRKTGTRIIMSAGIRKAIEEMLTDLAGVK